MAQRSLAHGSLARRLLAVAGAFFIIVFAGFAVMALTGQTRTVTIGDPKLNATTTAAATGDTADTASTTATTTAPAPLDEATYDAKMLAIANLPVITKKIVTGSTTITVTSTAVTGWPVKDAPYPDAGALLPFKRIVAYYGNFYSTQMGVLGEYPPDQMMAMLASTTAMWAAADPSTPVVPALDYIAVAAQASPGPDGKYRLRMPDSQIDQALALVQPVNGLVFLDIQVGLSNVETEVPLLKKYLAMPNVELSLDPEFDMHNGQAPGTVIGTMDASDINFAANYLANLVEQNNLPPKILVVHRFTEDMVTNYREIKPLPQVQIVMDMDGFGYPAKKINTYERVIVPEPVQFTGFKLFYKNDAKGPEGHLMTPEEVLQLSPQPSYIQYQ
ncbi:MAG TPA: hypothetical protein VMT81_01325 [Candidatus Paceibacterota bacterium]|nr:hypothetical protein [Candidatus Paceibacterota bacterium]